MLPAEALPLEGPFPAGRRLATSVRAILARVATAVRRVRLEHRWLILFVVLFLAFFVVLVFQPTVGRGGR